MPDTGERLARLETTVESINENINDLKLGQQQISKDIQKYRGFIGGVVFIISTLWGLFVLFFNSIFPNNTPH